jgi:hypothetical protein
MDLPSSKLSWHKRFISEGSDSCPSSEAISSGGSDPSSANQTQIITIHQHSDFSGVCKFLYFIIFVPYNSFRLFLVHKILASQYICENGKKKREKKKKKGFSASWAGGGGGFRPTRRGRACGPAARGDGRERRRGAGPTREGEGVADGIDGNRGRGGGSTGVRPAASPAAVLRRGSGSSAGKRWRNTGR